MSLQCHPVSFVTATTRPPTPRAASSPPSPHGHAESAAPQKHPSVALNLALYLPAASQ